MPRSATSGRTEILEFGTSTLHRMKSFSFGGFEASLGLIGPESEQTAQFSTVFLSARAPMAPSVPYLFQTFFDTATPLWFRSNAGHRDSPGHFLSAVVGAY